MKMNSKKVEKIYECEYCGAEFKTRELIIEHKKKCAEKLTLDFECSFCNRLFKSNSDLRKHVNKCPERPTFNCYGCNAIFYSKNDLNYHQLRCKSALIKCSWVTKANRRCTFTGKYEGYCKKHFIDYKFYDPNGIRDSEGGPEICSSIINKKYIPRTINHMVNGEFYSLEYIYDNSTFTIKEYNISNIIMENTETKETIIFWENKEARKHKTGKLITQLYANHEYECENDSILMFNNDTRMCKKCFEMNYNTTSNSLIIKTQNEDN